MKRFTMWLHRELGHALRVDRLVWRQGPVEYEKVIRYVCSCGRKWKP